MAQKISVTRTDDLDPSLEAETTVEFSLDGVAFEIDLTHANAEKLRESLARWVMSARKVSGRHRGGRPLTAGSASNKEELAAIRAWAASAGVTVPSRGRIGHRIREQYHAAVNK